MLLICALWSVWLSLWVRGSSAHSAGALSSPEFDKPQVLEQFLASGRSNLVGNNVIAAAFQALSSSPDVLKRVIEQVSQNVASALESATDPEAISYGGSPPVYPSPQGTGGGSWTTAYASARGLVANMSNYDKNTMLYGSTPFQYGCSGFIGSLPNYGFPGMCLNDGESGVRATNLVNGYPSQIHVGASWNRNLAYARALYLGQEFKAKGVNVALGPVIGPIGRVAKGGRNWEGFSNDPYLAGQLVTPTVTGLQASVIACAKHFIAYEQETNRQPYMGGAFPGTSTQSVSSNLDDRTMHELYLWPWYDAVKAGLGSVMCSYNRINNSYGCQNSKTMNGLLKTELGFQGFVVSDWKGQMTGIASANAGLDLAMPSSTYFDFGQLAGAVSNGSVTSSRLDDMVTRILASWYRFAKFNTPGIQNNQQTDARNGTANATLLQSAIEGHVLVKNVNNALPLHKPGILSLFGYDAIAAPNNYASNSLWYEYGLENTQEYPNGNAFTLYEAGLLFLNAAPPNTAGPGIALGGTMISGGGSGAITPQSFIAPYDALLQQTQADGTLLLMDSSPNPSVNPASDACIVSVNEQASESWDRVSLNSAYADKYIRHIASQCKNTIVVIHNAGVRLVDNWIDNPHITAVIFGHLPGQESGSALVELLYGRQSPSGRLPYTVPKTASAFGHLLNPTRPGANDSIYPQSNFTEGVYIDYKYFIKNNIQPRFAFGYGLTYTTFTYSNLIVTKTAGSNTGILPPDRIANISTPAPEGGLLSLYDVLVDVAIIISNTGKTAAAEVAQLYVGIPGGPPKVLRGFYKQLISPGGTAKYTFPLTRRDLSRWDTTLQQWVLQRGSYNIYVGKSVLDIQQQATLSF